MLLHNFLFARVIALIFRATYGASGISPPWPGRMMEWGRPGSESLTIGGQTYTVSAAYGTTSPTIILTYPDSSVVVKTLNSRGLLASIDRNSGDVVDRTYTDAGRLTTQTFANSVVESWSWNNDGTVDSIDNPAGLFEYSYDANKNRTAEQITGALSAASWTTGTTGFDDDDRLTYRNQTIRVGRDPPLTELAREFWPVPT